VKILIVEDDRDYQESLCALIRMFGGEALNAYTSEEAEKTLSANPGVSAIIVDGHLGEESNTVPLVARMREKYLGPIWGNTGDSGLTALLEKAGCDEVFFKAPGKGEKGIRDQLASFLTKK
jgi:DNA-binding NtrC family response regulator